MTIHSPTDCFSCHIVGLIWVWPGPLSCQTGQYNTGITRYQDGAFSITYGMGGSLHSRKRLEGSHVDVEKLFAGAFIIRVATNEYTAEMIDDWAA